MASGTHYRFNCQDKISEKSGGENMCWPHLRIHSLSRGASGGHCQYPTDRVPSHTGFKSRQGAGRASTHYHVSCILRPSLPAEMGSGATTRPTALNLTSLLRQALNLTTISRRASALPRVMYLHASPAYRGELRRYPCRTALDFASLRDRAPALPRILWLSVGHEPQV
jgi:hypothetical protein